MNEFIPNVVGIVGSPRRAFNTDTLVHKVLEGARSKGAATRHYLVSDYDIHACDACDACKHLGKCLQDDGMQPIYSALNATNALVIGTPIYCDHISAQTKLILDRMYPYVGANNEHFFPQNVKAVLVATWADPLPNLYDSVLAWLRDRLSIYFDIVTIEMIKAPDTGNSPAHQNPVLMQSAFDAGVRLIESVMA